MLIFSQSYLEDLPVLYVMCTMHDAYIMLNKISDETCFGCGEILLENYKNGIITVDEMSSLRKIGEFHITKLEQNPSIGILVWYKNQIHDCNCEDVAQYVNNCMLNGRERLDK